MRQWLLDKIIAQQEKFLGARLDYLREIGRQSLTALVKIAVIAPLARHRRKLQRTAYHLASIAVTRHEDCGECLQIAMNLARREGVPALYVNAVVQSRYGELPDVLRDVCEFADGVAQGWDNETLRLRLRQEYGEEGMIELALAISMARVYPTLKRAMGHAQRCTAPVLVGAPKTELVAA